MSLDDVSQFLHQLAENHGLLIVVAVQCVNLLTLTAFMPATWIFDRRTSGESMAQKQDLKAALDLSLKREEEYRTLFDEMKRVLDDAGEWR